MTKVPYLVRSDLLRHPAFANLGKDYYGNPLVWRNEYQCADRHDLEVWSTDWSCQCDDECPVCGASVSPIGADWLPACAHWTEDGKPDDHAYRLWLQLPEDDARDNGGYQSWVGMPGVDPVPAGAASPAPELTTITVVVSDSERPWPLLYCLQVSSPTDDDAIIRQIADIRYAETEDDDEQDEDVLRQIIDRLSLHFAFAGDHRTLADWRN